jgi:predicted deacylase
MIFLSKKRALLVLFFVTVLGAGALIIALTHIPKLVSPVETIDTGPKRAVIGTSVEGREIEAYTFLPASSADGKGETNLVFVGGIHGGYEWNSVVLAYTFIDYLSAHPEFIPENLTITIIPSANPDGVYKVIGKEGRFATEDVPKDIDTSPGRFNARGVDLNRNFDCRWSPNAVWREHPVGAGSSPFSEPEAMAIKNFMLAMRPDAVVFWHSQANAVYASFCETGILPKTLDIMNAYAQGSGYPAVKSFDAYEVTGDAEGWLASIGIPAITVELKTHETVEWEQNLAGIKALFKYYTK